MSNTLPTRALPERPSLAQLRKQAKELRKAFRAGAEAAIAEVNRFDRDLDPPSFALADAQRILARAYGFSSWPALKQHVEGLNAQRFCEAVEAGDVGLVRKLAQARPDLVRVSPDGQFGEKIALHLAVLKGNVEMTRTLLELGSDSRVGIWPHRSATTAYAIAKDRGYDAIVAIIEREEERRRQEMSKPGATIGSKTEEIQQAILENRCDEAQRILASDLSLIGACNLRGVTPLHVAAWTHNTEMMAWLIDRNAAVDATDAEGKTPLDYAALVAGWSAHGWRYTYMETAHRPPEVFEEIVWLLRSRGAELTPRAAVATGDKEAVLLMHRAGHLAQDVHCLRGGLLSIAVRANRIDMLSLLLDFGLDPDEAVMGDDGNRMSWGMPLWFAALCGRHECAELLLTRGADANAIVFASGDALGNAQDEEMQALLLKHGAHITVEHVDDLETAKAILNGTLRAHSLNVADPTPTDLAEQMLWAAGGGEEMVRLCLPHMTRKRDDPWWNYVLLHAKQPEGFKLILEHGVHPDVGGDTSYTILQHLGSDYVHEETRVARAMLLLDAGASLTKRDPLLKSTPLGWACRWGRVDLVKLYLSRGADAAESDTEPWATPLAWAEKRGHREIVELLRSHGAK